MPYSPTSLAVLVLLVGAAGAAHAQLSPPNASGVAMGHLHYNVRDVAANKAFWVGLGGRSVVFNVEKKTSVEEVNKALIAAADGKLKGILSYTHEPLVSMDFRLNPNSSIVDLLSTFVVDGNCVKVLSWYDNEWGFSCRVIDLIELLGRSM